MVIRYGSKSLICSEFQFYDFVVLWDITLYYSVKKRKKAEQESLFLFFRAHKPTMVKFWINR